jgi:hypothetical protein
VPAGVLANDVDLDGDGLTAAVVDGPAQGALALAPDGSFTYVPQEGFTGSVTFTYRARDPQAATSAVMTVTVVVQSTDVPVSTCRPVTPAAVHRVQTSGVDFMGEPFRGNRRLALIVNGTVPCVEVDTMETTRCVFWTADDAWGTSRVALQTSGPWMEDADGQRYAVVGQPVTRDGSLSNGAFIVATVPDADGSVTCMGASGRDAVGAEASTEMADSCVLETSGSETNVSGLQLVNFVTRYVGTTSVPHPDGAELKSYDPVTRIGWYSQTGAALNDAGGIERDASGFYFLDSASWSCHYIEVGGAQVPAAKRPSTRSTPYPGSVNVNSRVRWLVANPYVDIANDSPFDPRVGSRPLARFDYSVGLNTLWVDASPSQGDITKYKWDLGWTAKNPDAVSTSPTAEFPLAFTGVPPRSGLVTLTVTQRDQQTDRFIDRVVFRTRNPFPAGGSAAPGN